MANDAKLVAARPQIDPYPVGKPFRQREPAMQVMCGTRP